MKDLAIDLKIIGVVNASYHSPRDAPFQGGEEILEIIIDNEFEQGLTDIEGFSHLHIFYWLHQSKGFSLMVQTPWDSTPHGVFTTRSPHRPNPIAHAVVQLVERKKNILRVKGLDAINGTPIFDIKPYITNLDMHQKTLEGWITKSGLKRK
jgi:formylmethanofuran dehydrogenase subunit E